MSSEKKETPARDIGGADAEYVNCTHCGASVRRDEAILYEHRLLYFGEHFHCRECDPNGVWDCMSHDTDMEVH